MGPPSKLKSSCLDFPKRGHSSPQDKFPDSVSSLFPSHQAPRERDGQNLVHVPTLRTAHGRPNEEAPKSLPARQNPSSAGLTSTPEQGGGNDS